MEALALETPDLSDAVIRKKMAPLECNRCTEGRPRNPPSLSLHNYSSHSASTAMTCKLGGDYLSGNKAKSAFVLF